MKLIARFLPLLLCAAFAFGDTVTYTTNSFDFCTTGDGYPSACRSTIESVFEFPQFDSTLGTLGSMSFALADYADILWGFNDLYGGVGTEHDSQFNYTLSSLDQNLTYTAAVTNDFIATGGPHQISAGPQFDLPYVFSESGTFAIESYDVGDSISTRAFDFTGQVYGFYVGMDGLENNGVLSVTYDYTANIDPPAPVPEPRGAWLVIGVIGLLVLRRLHHCTCTSD